MKKIIAFAVTLMIIFTFSACKDSKKEPEKNTEIERCVSSGQFTDNDISLGDKADDVKAKLEEKAKNDESGETVCDVIEGENNLLISDGNYDYYSKKSDKNGEIGFIVCYKDVFGFSVGDIIIDVKQKLEGTDITELSADSEELFYVLGEPSAISALKVTAGENSALFVFEENALSSVAIYNNNWF